MYIGSGHLFIDGKFLAILKRMRFCQVEMETLLVRGSAIVCEVLDRLCWLCKRQLRWI